MPVSLSQLLVGHSEFLWVAVLVLAVTAVTQVVYLNKAMQLFDASVARASGATEDATPLVRPVIVARRVC